MRKYLLISLGLVMVITIAAFGLQGRSNLRSYFDFTGKLSSISVQQDVVDPILEPLAEYGLLPEKFLPGPLRASMEEARLAASASLTQSGTIKETNTQRAAFQLPALKENAKLDQSASLKLKDMFDKQYFEHISPSGAGPSDLAKQVGYQYILVGENLALGNFANDKVLVQAWMDSPGHRANILNDRYTEIGVAVGKGMYEGKETWLAVQSFGAPLSTCPQPNAQLKIDIATNQQLLNNMEAEINAMKQDLDANKNAPDYNDKVAVYNQKVKNFNALVATTKAQVATYNEQINAFNACVKA